jgi:c-di-AMP phosphodiesterase-like protein
MDKSFLKIFEPGARTIFFVLVLFTFVSLFLNIYVFWIEAVILVVLYLFYLKVGLNRQQSLARYIETLTYQVDSAAKNSLLNFPLPMAVVRLNGNISWYNSKFSDIIDSPDYLLEKSIVELFPDFHYEEIIEGRAQNPIVGKVGERTFHLYSNVINPKNPTTGLITLYLIEQTDLVFSKKELANRRSVAGILMIDNFEDIMQNAKEIEKANASAQMDKKVAQWAEKNGALLQKFARDKYLFVMEEPYLKKMIDDRFPILDQVKEILVGPNKMPVTISLGIGKDGLSFFEKFEFARAAMDVALGRGGDQVVIKSQNNFEFFGGKSKEIEKRTKVKSRVVATALKELISDSEQVYIMGHRFADIDSLGAAIGLYKIVVSMGKKGAILLSARSGAVDRLLDRITPLETYKEAFVLPQNVILPLEPKTLLIVVDTNNPDYVESPEVLAACNSIVVIDHHRRVGNYIEKATLNFHEPFASSACEMVTEILQYLEEYVKISKEEANALLAGLVLDTKSFTQRTGVRTFEAASYLKRWGADPTEAKEIFSNDLQSLRLKMQFIGQTKMIYEDIALSVWDQDAEGFTKELFAQAVDEMLAISGVKASFGIIGFDDEVHISARSGGEFNVQLIMEKLGGGGHQTVAGAQLKETTVSNAEKLLISAIGETLTVVEEGK